MTELLQFLIEYGYLVLLIWVALDQAALPIPSIPLLIGAGALAGMGQLSLPIVIGVTLLASIPINMFWFWLGRLRGARVLHLLCILSLEPDYCVRNTEDLFRRLGAFSVVIAKFIPGLQLLAPPMSGLTGMSLSRFFWLNALGTVLWAGTFILLGYFTHEILEQVILGVSEAGAIAGGLISALLAMYIVIKMIKRQLFVRSLDMRRLTPEAVYQRLEKGVSTHVLDLRHDYDLRAIPHLLPGASRLAMADIATNDPFIPRDKDIVLVCS
ncbi:MAG: membrane protein DedA with SNARE-associated domain [Candidatus Azotimanducaceae bacterium]|jgi:membrane protein DedA with SNARE-associated domain